MISLTDVSYRYPEAAESVLRGVDLEVLPGQVTGIVGASGAGKSTLAKVIAGFIPHHEGGDLAGSLTVLGQPTESLSLAERVAQVGLVLQNPFNQISGAGYSVRTEIAFGLENLAVPRAEMITRISRAAELLGITDLLDRSPYALSGGQQQLVALASMIVLQTPVLVLDEPTSQLDPAGTSLVFGVLGRLRDEGITVVVLEHKLEQLNNHCDRLHVLTQGQIVASGSPQQVLARPECDEWGIGSTNYTRAAHLAVSEGLAEPSAPLPVGYAEALSYFGEAL